MTIEQPPQYQYERALSMARKSDCLCYNRVSDAVQEVKMGDQRERLHAQIFGRVQGVSFRFHTLVTANDLKLVGWVRNLPDGSVEVVAEGSRSDVERLLEFLEHGPQGASVTRVDANWLPAIDEFSDFQVW